MTRHSWRRYLVSSAVAMALAVLVVDTASAHEVGAPRAPTPERTMIVRDSYSYNTDYLFAVTREVRGATESPALVVCFAPLTFALDVALFPFEALLGLLG